MIFYGKDRLQENTRNDSIYIKIQKHIRLQQLVKKGLTVTV